ncbi:hypothetical protein D9758_010163 [Tetrapyrgos nigripes]|uniref:Heterokaryon incompatibility domain-containing protein n=1 Tax=Tetrapyrgos nigripes TaxID=182062 RepID=A0A8H5CS74_9AGAR|nr:hypothetical protein D9758_010163 [Tetrapyrgos nigripes]
MHLLNTYTLNLFEFPGNHVPPYAILSHTWGKEEITFQDIQSSSRDALRRKAGFSKLQSCCNLARAHGFEYVWIDTCCINKDSSAELSEAINSMYRYYQDAEVCYAYLPDVSRDEDPRTINSSFRNCKWFTRGWTLQELLAPAIVIFFDVDWVEIGTKSSLQDVIEAVTGIPCNVLLDNGPQRISIATKMSWAAMRETTRAEDRAYCLMGIFGVHMPTLYGEGEYNAFIRLQLEIIKFSHDRSIFAWKAAEGDTEMTRGLLAKSPYEFRHSGNVRISDDNCGITPFSMTNMGLHIEFPMLPVQDELDDVFLAFLDCRLEKGGEQLCIHLKRAGHPDQNQFVRCWPDEIELKHASWRPPGTMSVYAVHGAEARRKKGAAKTCTFNLKPLHGFAGLAIQQKSYIWQSTEEREQEHQGGEIPFWGGLDRDLKLFVSNGSDITLLFLHEATGEKFGVIVGVHNMHIFSDIAIDAGLGMSPLEHELLKQSYTLGNRRHVPERGWDRVSRSLGGERLVSLAIRKTVKPGEYDIDIDITHGQPLTIRQLVPLEYGFLVKTDLPPSYRLKDVYPPDVFLQTQGDPDMLVNVYAHDEGSLKFSRMILFESSLGRPRQVAVFLGIYGRSQIRTDVIIDPEKSSSQSDEWIWSAYHQFKERWKMGSNLLHDDGAGLSRCSKVKKYRRDKTRQEFRATCTVVAGRRATLQPGSHWAHIDFKLSSLAGVEERPSIPKTPTLAPPPPPLSTYTLHAVDENHTHSSLLENEVLRSSPEPWSTAGDASGFSSSNLALESDFQAC